MVLKSISVTFCFLGAILVHYCAGYLTENRNPTRKCLKNGRHDLSFFDHSTRKFVHWLYRDPPVELVKDVINSRQHNEKLMKKVLSLERPILVLSGVLILFGLVTLISGIAICYRNIFRTPVTTNEVTSGFNDKWISLYMVALVIVSFLLLITDVGLFKANNHISESLPAMRNTLTKSIDGLGHFQNNTVQGLNQILRDDFESAIGDSMSELRTLAGCRSEDHSISPKFEPLKFNEASELALSALKDTREILVQVNSTLRELQMLSRGLNSELGKMHAYYKEARQFCFGKGHVKDDDELCKMFIDGNVFTKGKPLEVSESNVSVVVSNLDHFLKTRNFTPVHEIINHRGGIASQLCKKRSDKLKALEKISSGLRFGRNFVLYTLKKYSNEMVDKALIPARRQVNTVLSKDSRILTYDHYRWWIAFLMSCGILFAFLTTIAGVSVKGTEPFLVQWSSPFLHLQNLLNWLPKWLFLSSLGLHVSLAVFVNIFAGLVFVILSNMAIACDISTDYEHLDSIIGTPDLLKESHLFSDGKKPIKIFKTISECPEGATLWTMFNLDKEFDLNTTIAKIDKIPEITERLFHDSSDLNKTSKINSPKMPEIFEQWDNLGLGDINIDLLLRQVNHPVVDQSFYKLSKALMIPYRSNHVGTVNQTQFKMFQGISSQAFIIKEDYIKMYSLSKLLRQQWTDFEESREKSLEYFANASDVYSNIVEQGDLWHKNTDGHIQKVVDVIKDYLKNGFHKVQSEVGLCDSVQKAYNDTVCSICHDIFGSWNTWWILLLVCGCLTMLSLVFCTLILRKMNGTKSTEQVS